MKITDIIFGFFGILIPLIQMASYWILILFHLFTAFILWQIDGLFFGILALIFPFAAEVYAFIRCWINAGLFNIYTIATLIAIVFFFLPFAIGFILYKIHDDEK